ncbi:MAG: ABC transporter permease, partial [Bryobacteraceae bacterium]
MRRRERMMDDLDRDIREHIAMEMQDNIDRGMSPGEARYAALRKFGNVTRVKEEARDVWSLVWLEQFWQDMRYALRMLRKSPGFAAIAVLTIALGIGATTAIFSVVDATLLHPLPYPEPEQLVSIIDDLPDVGAKDVGISVPEWQDLQRSGIFQYVSPVGGGSVNLTGSSQPERIFFGAVSPNYFALLGVKPQLGRSFNPEDHTPGFTLEVLISDGLWKRAFGGDPQVLGRNVRLDNDLYQIIGVMPAGYRDPGRTTDERNTEMWAATG